MSFGRIVPLSIAILFAVYFLATLNLRSLGVPIGDWPQAPRFVYTKSEIALTFDGQEINIEGTTRCKRRFELNEHGDLLPLMFLHVGFTYYCGPDWFAHRFGDGSALLVGAYSVNSPRPRGFRYTSSTIDQRDHFDGEFRAGLVSQTPPAVLWIDNAERPTKAEYYYSMEALDDPTSRLTSLQYDVEMWAASVWTSIFTGQSPTDSSIAVPAATKHSSLREFKGHYALALPEQEWSQIEGLATLLAEISSPTLLRVGEHITKEQAAALRRLLASKSRHPIFGRVGGSAWTGEEDSTNLRPTQSVMQESGQSTSFRFEENPIVGLITLLPHSAEGRSAPVDLAIGDTSVSSQYGAMWYDGMLYEPATQTVFRLRTVFF